MYTLVEVAQILRVSKATLYRLTSSRKINSRKVGGQLRFTKKDIADYLGILASEIQICEV